MYPCPREILLHIFQFACDDDGTTGRTLSLVSRQFYQLTQNCKYRSIALVGLPQIASFVAMLEQLPKIPPVRHLFLSSVTQNATNGRQRITDAMQTYVRFQPICRTQRLTTYLARDLRFLLAGAHCSCTDASNLLRRLASREVGHNDTRVVS